MTQYRRSFIAGGYYFFTVALAERSSNLLTAEINWLKKSFCGVKEQKPFRIDALVVLPDHLHCIWVLPPGDADYPTRWKMIKAFFSRGMPKTEQRSASRRQKGERGIWQRRYWEHTLRNEIDWRRHMDYIHFNPVKHAYVQRVRDWPYSTFHRYVRQGIYTLDWGGDSVVQERVFGE